jgi:hypothetical protein
MLTVFSDLYLKLVYSYLKEEESNLRESIMKRKTATKEEDDEDKRMTVKAEFSPVINLEEPIKVDTVEDIKVKILENIEAETREDHEWNAEYI